MTSWHQQTPTQQLETMGFYLATAMALIQELTDTPTHPNTNLIAREFITEVAHWLDMDVPQ